MSERNWPEDYQQENGRYSNTCLTCRESFVGHKRRVTCKKCAAPADAPLTANTLVDDKPATPGWTWREVGPYEFRLTDPQGKDYSYHSLADMCWAAGTMSVNPTERKA